MKKVIMTISNEGSAGKTTIAKAIKETYMNHKVAHTTLLCDKDHTELLDTYGESEVRVFDIRTDKEALINYSLESDSDVIVDFPAAAIDELYRVFGDMKVFMDSFDNFDAKLVFVVPVMSEKSILSIVRFEELLSNIDSNYEYVFVLNEGLMSNKEALTFLFKSNEVVKSLISAGKAQIVTISTVFTSSFAQVVKAQKLREFLTKKSTPMERILMSDFLKKTDRQFAAIFNLPAIDDDTELEKLIKTRVQ